MNITCSPPLALDPTDKKLEPTSLMKVMVHFTLAELYHNYCVRYVVLEDQDSSLIFSLICLPNCIVYKTLLSCLHICFSGSLM